MSSDSEIIKEELKSILNKLGHFPTMSDLRILKRGDLLYRINKSGGINHYRNLLNIDPLQVPNGYYEDFNNVVKVINDYINVYNEFPTIIALDKFKPGIKFAILKYHGGYRAVRDKLNVPQLAKEDGHWKNFENVRKELIQIKAKIGAFPGVEDIKEYGPPGLYAGICMYHDGLQDVQKRVESKVNHKSILEKKVKAVLDQYVISSTYTDNGKKKLYSKYGIKLIHPINKTYLELDRYYPEYRVGIEVQGTQHEEEVPYFAKQKNMSPGDYLEYIKWLDNEKRLQCIEQNITLIYCTDNMSIDDILNEVSDDLPLRSSPKEIEDYSIKDRRKTQKEILLKLESGKESPITSDDIREYSVKFYNDLLDDYGTLSAARLEFGIAPVREHRDYWTFNKVLSELSILVSQFGKFPRKEDVSKINNKLYYGIVKHGGLQRLKQYYNF